MARNILLHADADAAPESGNGSRSSSRRTLPGLPIRRRGSSSGSRQLGQQVQQFEQQMAAMRNQVSAFERGQERQAAQVQGFDQALRGVTPTIDPYGNEREVWTGPYANYWQNGAGQVVNSTNAPGAGWTQLRQEQ